MLGMARVVGVRIFALRRNEGIFLYLNTHESNGRGDDPEASGVLQKVNRLEPNGSPDSKFGELYGV